VLSCVCAFGAARVCVSVFLEILQAQGQGQFPDNFAATPQRRFTSLWSSLGDAAMLTCHAESPGSALGLRRGEQEQQEAAHEFRREIRRESVDGGGALVGTHVVLACDVVEKSGCAHQVGAEEGSSDDRAEGPSKR